MYIGNETFLTNIIDTFNQRFRKFRKIKRNSLIRKSSKSCQVTR